MYYQLGRAGRALDRFGVIEFATTIAPGVRDVLLTGKVYEAVQRNSRNKGADQYDAVVLDAPPTGRITQFLNVNGELAGLAKVGPDQDAGRHDDDALPVPRTAVHLVTVLEEMPVQETADGIAELRAAGLPVGGVVVNLVRPRDLDAEDLDAAVAGDLDPAAIEADLKAAGVDVDDELVDGLLDEARDHAERRALEDDQRELVAGARRADVRAAPAGRRRRPRRALRARRRPPRAGDGMTPAAPESRTRASDRWPRPGPAPPLDVDALLDDRGTGIIVCCGSGGVGKTTTSAALALRAAERGRKVVVLTIDPARRLAQSMGIEALDNTPRPVPGDRRRPEGRPLDAMMLDMKRTFDEVVESQASPEKAKQILANPFYIALSSSFAGTQEYMAMEKLGQIHADAQRDGSYDLIVVDTPPSRSALDFLDAPERLSSFLDGRFIRLLLAPARGRRG